MTDEYQVFELPCYDNRASFHHKAHVVVSPDRNTFYLVSYSTLVASIRRCGENDKTFLKHWSGYSATTMRHIDSFRRHYGLLSLGKSKWDSLPFSDLPYATERNVLNLVSERGKKYVTSWY